MSGKKESEKCPWRVRRREREGERRKGQHKPLTIFHSTQQPPFPYCDSNAVNDMKFSGGEMCE
jgi:hypothetical protein